MFSPKALQNCIFDTHENCQKRLLDHQQEKTDLSFRQLLEKHELGEQFLETVNSPAPPRATQARPVDTADDKGKPLGILQVWPKLLAPASSWKRSGVKALWTVPKGESSAQKPLIRADPGCRAEMVVLLGSVSLKPALPKDDQGTQHHGLAQATEANKNQPFPMVLAVRKTAKKALISRKTGCKTKA